MRYHAPVDRCQGVAREMGFWSEVKRRNVFRMAILYIVSSWLILQVADLLFDLMGIPDWSLRLVLVLLILGLPVAMVFSWLYELTPDGLKRESDVPRATSITDRTGRKLNALTLAVGILAIALVVYQQLFPSGQMESSVPAAGESVGSAEATAADKSAGPSIAVLPFVNLSGSEENEYFSDGLTETLLHSLASIQDLRVAARTSSFAFKGKDSDVRQIAEALGVAHVLEGSVQRAGDRMRITAQLVRASDGFHVWSANFDRTVDDIFAIQDEIAGEVVAALSTSLLSADEASNLTEAGTESISAYDLYLRALSETAKGSYGNLQEAERLLKQALTEDPGFADAKTQLAVVYRDQAGTGLLANELALRQASALLEQVVETQPKDIRARTYLAMTQAQMAFEAGNVGIVAGLISQLRALIAEAPSATEPRRWLAVVLSQTGKEEEALAEYQRVLELDPLNPEYHYEIARVYHQLERHPAAKRAMMRSLELEPEQPNAASLLAQFSLYTGDAVGFVENGLRAMELDPQDHELSAGVSNFLYQFGLIDEGDRFLARAEAIAPSSPAVRHARLVRALEQGDREQAVTIARGMISDGLDNRHGSEWTALNTLFDQAVRTDTVNETLEFMDRHYPGFRSLDDGSVPFRARAIRLNALGAWATVLPRDELNRRMDELFAVFRQFGEEFEDAPTIRIEAEALRGNVDNAIRIALDDLFAEPATLHRNWRLFFERPHLAEVAADARIQAAMEQREKDMTIMAEEVRRYFEQNVSFGAS